MTELRRCATWLRPCAHPHLVRVVDVRDTGDTIAVRYDWVDGLPIGIRQGHLDRMRALPVELRVQAVADLIAVHQYLDRRGRVAIDLYDESVLLDPDNGRATL